ncbi:MAG: hypothetical protein ACM3JB_07260 [Acidobacteriaceae bacterium]
MADLLSPQLSLEKHLESADARHVEDVLECMRRLNEEYFTGLMTLQTELRRKTPRAPAENRALRTIQMMLDTMDVFQIGV